MICTLDGRLLAITDPLPGSRHDARAFRAHGLDQLLDSSTLADKGYVGLGLTTPTKRRPGLGLLREQKTNNRVLNRLRSVVERVITQVKTWRILHTGFRRPLGSYGRVFSSGAGVGVFGCGAPLMNKPPCSLSLVANLKCLLLTSSDLQAGASIFISYSFLWFSLCIQMFDAFKAPPLG